MTGAVAGQSEVDTPEQGDQIIRRNIAGTLLAKLRRHGLLKTLVHNEEISKAVSEVSLEADEAREIYQKYRNQNKLDTEAKFNEHLEMIGLAAADLQWQLELPLRIRKAAKRQYLHLAEKRFLERKSSLDEVVYSLIRLSDQDLAREVYLQVVSKEEDMGVLAQRYSTGPEKSSRGIIGPRPIIQAHPTLRQKLQALKEGEVSEPFPIEQWWLIVRLEERRPAILSEEVATQMAIEMFNEQISSQSMASLKTIMAQLADSEE